MFENIIVRNTPRSRTFDAGTLAEILLFYGKAKIVLDYGRLTGLASTLGPSGLDYLLSSGRVEFVYSNHSTGVYSTQKWPLTFHKMTGFSLGEKPDAQEQIVTLLGRLPRFSPIASEFTAKILAKSEVVQDLAVLAGPNFYEDLSAEMAIVSETSIAAREILEEHLGHPVGQIQFCANQTPDGLSVETNVDFNSLNNELARNGRAADKITSAVILAAILDARVDLALAGHYGCEFMGREAAAAINKAKISQILSKAAPNASHQIGSFADIAFDGASISETINSGTRSFDDFIKVLDKAEKFRNWIENVPPDGSLAREYFKQATGSTWIDKLPSRVVRFAIFFGLGAAVEAVAPSGLGMLGGVGLGVADTFLLDKMIKGWKPNHFVERELSTFLEPPK